MLRISLTGWDMGLGKIFVIERRLQDRNSAQFTDFSFYLLNFFLIMISAIFCYIFTINDLPKNLNTFFHKLHR
jgi:hypothetical protein